MVRCTLETCSVFRLTLKYIPNSSRVVCHFLHNLIDACNNQFFLHILIHACKFSSDFEWLLEECYNLHCHWNNQTIQNLSWTHSDTNFMKNVVGTDGQTKKKHSSLHGFIFDVGQKCQHYSAWLWKRCGNLSHICSIAVTVLVLHQLHVYRVQLADSQLIKKSLKFL